MDVCRLGCGCLQPERWVPAARTVKSRLATMTAIACISYLLCSSISLTHSDIIPSVLPTLPQVPFSASHNFVFFQRLDVAYLGFLLRVSIFFSRRPVR